MAEAIEPNRRILVIDDNEAIHEDIRKVLAATEATTSSLDALDAALFGGGARAETASTRIRYEVDAATQGKEGLEMVRRAKEAGRPYAVAFVDMRMPPGWDGVETIEQLWKADPELQAVICTAYSDYSRDQIVERLGVTHRLLILKKPFDNAEVSQLACALTEKWWQTRQANLKLEELERIAEARAADLLCANARLQAEMAERERVALALQSSEERYALAARGANDGLWDWDLASDQIYYSSRFRSMLGLGDHELTGLPSEWLDRLHQHDVHGLRTALGAHLEGQAEHFEAEHRLLCQDGGYRWFVARGLAVRGGDGKPMRMAGSLSDIHQRKEAEEELRRGAFYDRLTGLPNRTLIKSCIHQAIKNAETPGHDFAVLFLDFDRFKLINDSFGHQTGDQLLIAIARRLTADLMARQDDARQYTIGRLSGDEFVVIVAGINDIADAMKAGEDVLAVLAKPFQAGQTEVFCSASIGVVMGSAAFQHPDDLLRDADVAMYHAKAGGKNRCAVFDASMRARAMARMHLETELRRAVERRDLDLVYQPVLDMRDGRIHAFEALLRWKHIDDGLISPERFIPIAEETGLIAPLGRWVIEQACKQMREWRNASPVLRRCRVNVNVSRIQFVSGNIVEAIQEVLKDSDVPPEMLVLEVTESTIMDDLDSSRSILDRLNAIGVRVHMDDFGTGYSSLSCLRKLALDGLKIDRSFVGYSGEGSEDPAIIHAIVTLARNLRMSVTAEGVETAEQLATVLALDCDYAQGFYFAQPMYAPNILDWVANFRPARRAAA